MFLLQMTIVTYRGRALVRTGPQRAGKESTGDGWAESQGWALLPYSARSHQVSSDSVTEMNREGTVPLRMWNKELQTWEHSGFP